MHRWIFVFLCAFVLFLTGWGHQGPKVKVGLLMNHTRGFEVFIRDLTGSLQEENGDLLVEDAKDDPSTQENQAKELINQGVETLVILPVDPSWAAPIVEDAHRAGIKVIALHLPIPDSGLDYLITFDPEKKGELQAKAMVQAVPKGNYFLLGSSPVEEAKQRIRHGQLEVLQPLIDRGDIRIVGSAEVIRLNSTMPHSNVDAVLEMNPSGVRTDNQFFGSGHPAKKIAVAGMGWDLGTCRRIVSGDQLMTVYDPPFKLAEETAYLAAKLARKAKQFDCQFEPFPAGSQPVQAVLLTPLAVDAKNLDSTIIKDGIQTKEAVYGK
jgi:D-xylose transport system substrate-binding protein